MDVDKTKRATGECVWSTMIIRGRGGKCRAKVADLTSARNFSVSSAMVHIDRVKVRPSKCASPSCPVVTSPDDLLLSISTLTVQGRVRRHARLLGRHRRRSLCRSRQMQGGGSRIVHLHAHDGWCPIQLCIRYLTHCLQPVHPKPQRPSINYHLSKLQRKVK